MYYKPRKFNQNRWSHFLRKSRFLIFFSCELPLILGAGEKLKKNGSRYSQEDQDIEFERDRSIGLGSMIDDGQTDKHTHFF